MRNELKLSYVLNVRSGSDKTKLQNKIVPIRMIVSFNGDRYFCGIKHSVKLSQWDSTNHIVIKHPDSAVINKDLHDIHNKINLIVKYRLSTNDKEMNFDSIKKIVDEVVSEVRDIPIKSIPLNTSSDLVKLNDTETPKPDEYAFYTAYDQFCNDTKSGLRKRRIRKTHANIKDSTQKAYSTLLSKLLIYDPARTLTFDDINKNFYNKFIQFLQNNEFVNSKTGEKKKLSDSTVGNMIKILKAFLRYSHNEGWHTNINYLNDYFISPKDSVQREFLNVEELKKLWYYNPINDRMKNTKNVFMFQCFSGIRYSDLRKITPDSIDSDRGLIMFDQEKTGGKAFISFHKFMLKILDDTENFKINWSILSNDKLNANIQELCEKSGINSKVIPYKIVLGKKVNIYDTPKQKHEIITSHCGRHSFVTLCSNELGLPDEIVRVFSGHSSQDSLQRYKHNVEKRACQLLNSAIDEFIVEYDFDPFKTLENSIEE
jgi:integrase